MRRRHDDHPHRARSAARSVEITLLGTFGLTVDGMPIEASSWIRRGAADLVKVLALAPGHRLHREKAMDLLWPGAPLEIAAPRLHKAAHFARRVTGRDRAVTLRREIVSLFPDAALTVDVVRFEELARVAVDTGDPAAAREALTWYGGELLPDDPYEDWAVDRRELLQLRRLELLRVAGEWRELTALDPTNEDAHRQLLRRHLEAGDAPAVLTELERHERSYASELDLRPPTSTPRVQALLEELAELRRRQQDVLAQLAAASAGEDSYPPTGRTP